MECSNARTIKLKDGTVLMGVFDLNRKLIEGKVEYINGGFKTGRFIDRKLNCEYGEQKLVTAHKCCYLKGNFTDGKLNGYGVIYNKKNNTLEMGLFSNNTIVFGTMVCSNNIYIGGFIHKQLTCEYGVALFSRGTRIYGKFNKNSLEGYGKYTLTEQNGFWVDIVQLEKLYNSIQSIGDIIRLMGVDDKGNALYLEYPNSENIIDIITMQYNEEKNTNNELTEETKRVSGLDDKPIANKTALLNEIKAGVVDRSYNIYATGYNFSHNNLYGEGTYWHDGILYKGIFLNDSLNGEGDIVDTKTNTHSVGIFSKGYLTNGKIYVDKKLSREGSFCDDRLTDGIRYEYRPSGIVLKYDHNDVLIDDTPERMAALEDKVLILTEMISKMQSEIITLRSQLANRDNVDVVVDDVDNGRIKGLDEI